MGVLSDLLMSRGQKLHLQDMLRLPFSEHGSDEEACSLVALAQNNNYFRFFLFPITFPHIPHTSALSHEYPEPLAFLWGGGFEICSPVSLLGYLMNKPFLCCKPRHLKSLACCATGKQTWFGSRDSPCLCLFSLCLHE